MNNNNKNKVKQVKLIEAKDLEEMEQKVNGFYVEADMNCYDVISTKFIEKEPLTLQIIFLKEVSVGVN